jgi:hypothetical protein
MKTKRANKYDCKLTTKFFKLNKENKQLFEIKISKSKLGFSKWTKINVQNQNMEFTFGKNYSPYHK